MHRILIVEDEARLAAFVDKGLRKNGFATRIVGDVLQALTQVQTEAVDLMLLDLGLPKLDGWGVLKALRDQGNSLPVIVMTASAEPRETILSAGANACIAKPFRFQELLTTIQALL